MKIFCCLNADAVSNVALNLLLPALAPHEVRVGLSTRIGGRVTGDEAETGSRPSVDLQPECLDDGCPEGNIGCQ